MSEEEVGQEFDRVVRAAMMAVGQVREQIARARSAADQKTREAAQIFLRGQEAQTERIYGMVNRDSFWAAANGERVANAATYGATLSHTDPKAMSIYETVRDNVWQRYGINVDDLRAQHPTNEDARYRALMHAVDDRIAAMRDETLAREEAARAEVFEDRAVDERQQVDAEVDIADMPTPEAEQHEAAARGEARGYEVDRDSHRAGAATATTDAARVRRQANASYPQNAKVALAESRTSRQPKGRGGRGAQQGSRPRSSGLSR